MYDEVYKTVLGFELPEGRIPTEHDMKRCSQGDKTIINELVEGLIKLMVESVEWYLRHHEHAQPFAEDCIAEGMLALTEFVTDHVEKQIYFSPPKFIGHARKACLNQISDWLRTYPTAVTMSKNTQRRQKQMTQVAFYDPETSKDYVFDTVWFDLFMNSLDLFDQLIVRRKIAGHTIERMSKDLHMDKQNLKRRLAELYSIYEGNEVCDEY